MPHEERYDNPVDGKAYVTKGGWKTYKPNEPRPSEEVSRIHAAEVRFLTAESDMESPKNYFTQFHSSTIMRSFVMICPKGVAT